MTGGFQRALRGSKTGRSIIEPLRRAAAGLRQMIGGRIHTSPDLPSLTSYRRQDFTWIRRSPNSGVARLSDTWSRPELSERWFRSAEFYVRLTPLNSPLPGVAPRRLWQNHDLGAVRQRLQMAPKAAVFGRATCPVAGIARPRHSRAAIPDDKAVRPSWPARSRRLLVRCGPGRVRSTVMRVWSLRLRHSACRHCRRRVLHGPAHRASRQQHPGLALHRRSGKCARRRGRQCL